MQSQVNTDVFVDQGAKSEKVAVLYVIEDDGPTREALEALFAFDDFAVKCFTKAEEFLALADVSRPAALVLDEKLPGMNGSDLLRTLHAEGRGLPSVLLTAHATTPVTVAAMQHGAVTVLDKPCHQSAIRTAVVNAIEQDSHRAEMETVRQAAKRRLAELSDSEREVLEFVLEGLPNKQIARRLSVCVRTVEARRSRIYNTMEVRSVAELVRMCVSGEFIGV